MLENASILQQPIIKSPSVEKYYYIETYGCQMNVYDSELVESLLNECGYSITSDIRVADAIFLNKAFMNAT